jgi:dihydrofolate reductase
LHSIINNPLLTIFNNDIIMKQKNYIMKKNNDIIKQPMKNINTMKIMKKFLFLKIFLFALYSPTIFAITCSTGSGGGGGDSATYTWSKIRSDGDAGGFTDRYSHSSVALKDKIFVIGGEIWGGSNAIRKNDVWSSGDGVTWTTATDSAKFSARSGHQSVVFDEKMWLIGGTDGNYLNDVWNSSDGKTWELVTNNPEFKARRSHQLVVFDEKMWVIGGYEGEYLSDVWSSEDGVTWDKKTDSAQFSGREDFASVVFDDGEGEKMWVIGGSVGIGNNVNDVWSSEDGVTWDKKTDSAQFSGRWKFESVVFDNKMWVFGGDERSTVNDEVWSSTNGITWTERATGSSTKFTGRHSHSSVVFRDEVWVIGGLNEILGLGGNNSPYFLNDVWSMERD